MADPTDIGALSLRAKSGDADAQYKLAARLSQAGRRDEAGQWLRSAADLGHPDALYTLASRQLKSDATTKEALQLLARAAEQGSSTARRLTAVHKAMGVGADVDETGAIIDIVDLARLGDEGARCEIACMLAITDPDDTRIATLLKNESYADPIAAAFRVARMMAGRPAGDAGDLSRSQAVLKNFRYPRAQALRDARAVDDGLMTPIDWASLRSQSLLEPRLHAPAERVCSSPDAVIFRAAVAPEICEYVIAHAASRLAPSLVFDPTGGGMIRDPLRTSKTASLSTIDLDLALIALCKAMASAVGEPHENGEFLSVLKYRPGEQYRPHFDSIPPGPDFDRCGQRTKTAILFLNDDFAGGETHFIGPDLKIRGRSGDLLVFSTLDAKGCIDPSSRHAGLPVTAGEKWIVTRWFRQKKYVP